MDYIIFDLEFNQPFNTRNRNIKCPFEIIQIGALKIDYNHNNISHFNALVKPSIYTELHPFVEKLTKITMNKLMLAKPFDIVLKDFSMFIKDNDNIFCVWGLSDMKELFKNITYHKLDDNLPKKYINIQYYASKHLYTPNGKNIGLKNAIELLNIPLEKQFHDAFNDAFYTTEIFKKLHIECVKPKIYKPNQIRSNNKYRTKRPKKKIDIEGLIKQFEKMYKKKMTEEEISMITLSYKMGLTKQFQIQKNKNN